MLKARRVAMAAALGALCLAAALPAGAGAASSPVRTPLNNHNEFNRVAASVVWLNRSVIVSGREWNLRGGSDVCYWAYDSFGTMVASTCRSVSSSRGFDFTLHPREPHAIRYVKAVSVISRNRAVPAFFIAGSSRPSSQPIVGRVRPN